MIPVDRGAEPRALEDVRAERLPKAVSAFNVHGPGSKQLHKLLDGYDVAKRHLFLRQHKKCAYCERTPGLDGQPVEHFRPKKHVSRRIGGQRKKDHERYWWLTWTWENLLFACTTCNGPANKGNDFPLVAGSPPLPCLHLEALADEVAGRYRDTVWPRFHREIERRLEVATPTQRLAAWNKLVRDLVQPTSSLTAATWSMLDVLRTSTRALRSAQLPAPPRP